MFSYLKLMEWSGDLLRIQHPAGSKPWVWDVFWLPDISSFIQEHPLASTGGGFFPGLAALKLKGEHIISPGDEPGARGSPGSAPAAKLVWLLLLPASVCLARGDLPWACAISEGIPASRAQGRGRSLGEGRVPAAESWAPAWHPRRVAGLALQHASSWVCAPMASVALEHLEEEQIPVNWTFRTMLLCIYLKNFSFAFHRCFVTIGILSDTKHFL